MNGETTFIEDTPTDMEGDTVTVTEDTVLTVIYDPIFYTVSFSSDGGTGAMDSIRVRHSDTVPLPSGTRGTIPLSTP